MTRPPKGDAALAVTGRQTELGRLLPRHTAQAGLHINLAGQQANTLLHDGHGWQDFARKLREGTRRALRAEADFLVHASFAWVLGDAKKDPLRSLAETLLECEQEVLAGPTAACVLRLGYLYGPHSQDLGAYRTAFRLGRPYWAGPRGAGQFHLHQDDAVSALLAAGSKRHAGRSFYAVAGPPVPFMQFMDHFARRLGTRFPLHVPRLAAPLMKLLVRQEHMQQVALAMPQGLPTPRLPGWQPAWLDHRKGLEQVIEAWKI